MESEAPELPSNSHSLFLHPTFVVSPICRGMCDPAHTFEARDGRDGALLHHFFCLFVALHKMTERPFARTATGPTLDGFRAMPYKGAYVLALRIVWPARQHAA